MTRWGDRFVCHRRVRAALPLFTKPALVALCFRRVERAHDAPVDGQPPRGRHGSSPALADDGSSTSASHGGRAIAH